MKHPALKTKQEWTITVPEGTLLKEWPVGSNCYELVLSMSKDSCAYLRVYATDATDRPDLFEMVKS